MPIGEILMSPSVPKRSKRFEQRYISVSELAARWSVSASAIYSRKCGSHALKAIRFGRAVRFLRTEVETLERDRESGTRNNPGLQQATSRFRDDTLAS
jgi:predicted DNA-binding transcriptional regulator AlpA